MLMFWLKSVMLLNALLAMVVVEARILLVVFY